MTSAHRPQQLGFWMCVALVVGNTIGSGIFLIPAALAPFGLNSLLAWLLTAVGALCLAAVFARLSRAFPQAGGPYAYVRLAFGPFMAFIVAWGYWVSIWVGNVSITTGAVSYLIPLVPQIGNVPGAAAAVTLLFLWVLTLVNWRGVKAAGWVQGVTTLLKLLPLAAIALLGVWTIRPANFTAAANLPITAGSVTAAATLTLWTILGIESATIPADKVRNPAQTIPAATMIGALITIFICALPCTAVLLLLPHDALLHSDAPFADLARAYWGPAAAVLVSIAAVISGFGALNGWILLQAEMPRVMAKNGVFPSVFARESPRGTPTFALFFSSGLVSVLVLINYQASMVRIFTFMVLLSTSACLVLYALCSIALLRLQWTGYSLGRGTLGIAVLGILATTYSLWAILGAGVEALLWCAALLALGVPVYGWMRWRGTANDTPIAS